MLALQPRILALLCFFPPHHGLLMICDVADIAFFQPHHDHIASNHNHLGVNRGEIFCMQSSYVSLLISSPPPGNKNKQAGMHLQSHIAP
ncbi:hypothetical protein GE09DRAFT_610488 [Coniochaeta sp. 2T2.1]|nr:hypothetical protein GE09DRAFT_610488 [Coniochaeta sp. 2T2.1]